MVKSGEPLMIVSEVLVILRRALREIVLIPRALGRKSGVLVRHGY